MKVIYLNRKEVMNLIDEAINRGRKIPRGPLSLVDILMMDYFERQQAISRVEDIATFPIDLVRDPSGTIKDVKRKAKRKKSAYGRALSRELKDLNKKARTKSGRLRKGVTQGNLLSKAHRNVKRRMKKGGRR